MVTTGRCGTAIERDSSSSHLLLSLSRQVVEAFQLGDDSSFPAVLLMSLIGQVCFDQCLVLGVAAVRATPAAFGVTPAVLTLGGHGLIEVVFLATDIHVHASVIGRCSVLLVGGVLGVLVFDAEVAS